MYMLKNFNYRTPQENYPEFNEPMSSHQITTAYSDEMYPIVNKMKTAICMTL